MANENLKQTKSAVDEFIINAKKHVALIKLSTYNYKYDEKSRAWMNKKNDSYVEDPRAIGQLCAFKFLNSFLYDENAYNKEMEHLQQAMPVKSSNNFLDKLTNIFIEPESPNNESKIKSIDIPKDVPITQEMLVYDRYRILNKTICELAERKTNQSNQKGKNGVNTIDIPIDAKYKDDKEGLENKVFDVMAHGKVIFYKQALSKGGFKLQEPEFNADKDTVTGTLAPTLLKDNLHSSEYEDVPLSDASVKKILFQIERNQMSDQMHIQHATITDRFSRPLTYLNKWLKSGSEQNIVDIFEIDPGHSTLATLDNYADTIAKYHSYKYPEHNFKANPEQVKSDILENGEVALIREPTNNHPKNLNKAKEREKKEIERLKKVETTKFGHILDAFKKYKSEEPVH